MHVGEDLAEDNFYPRSSKGGDRRRLMTSAGMDLRYARLLFRALDADKSLSGKRYRAAKDKLARRWLRWTRHVADYVERQYGEPPPFSTQHVAKYLDAASVRLSCEYPRPRALTAEEDTEFRRRMVVADGKRRALFQSVPLEQQIVGRAAFDRAVADELYAWATEPKRVANPGRRRRQSSNRVSRYVAEVEAFCEEWRLHASWAVPAIIVSHFTLARLGDGEVLWMTVNTYDAHDHSLYVPLPGRTSAEVKESRELLATAQGYKDLTHGEDSLRVVWRPTREEFEAIERETSAACLVLDWDGQPLQPSRFAANVRRTAMQWVWEEVEHRIDRALTKREREAISKAVRPQIDDAREMFLLDGHMLSAPRADPELQAEWVATRLLDPRLTYNQMEARGSGHRDFIRHSCDQFARIAGLRLSN